MQCDVNHPPALHQFYTLLTRNVFGSTRAFLEPLKMWNFRSGNNKNDLEQPRPAQGWSDLQKNTTIVVNDQNTTYAFHKVM